MTVDQLRERIAIARKAPPGPWEYCEASESVYGKNGKGLITCPLGEGTAQHIAANIPEAVIALCEDLLAARENYKRISDEDDETISSLEQDLLSAQAEIEQMKLHIACDCSGAHTKRHKDR